MLSRSNFFHCSLQRCLCSVGPVTPHLAGKRCLRNCPVHLIAPSSASRTSHYARTSSEYLPAMPALASVSLGWAEAGFMSQFTTSVAIIVHELVLDLNFHSNISKCQSRSIGSIAIIPMRKNAKRSAEKGAMLSPYSIGIEGVAKWECTPRTMAHITIGLL